MRNEKKKYSRLFSYNMMLVYFEGYRAKDKPTNGDPLYYHII